MKSAKGLTMPELHVYMIKNTSPEYCKYYSFTCIAEDALSASLLHPEFIDPEVTDIPPHWYLLPKLWNKVWCDADEVEVTDLGAYTGALGKAEKNTILSTNFIGIDAWKARNGGVV